jgi:hypothetical protein
MLVRSLFVPASISFFTKAKASQVGFAPACGVDSSKSRSYLIILDSIHNKSLSFVSICLCPNSLIAYHPSLSEQPAIDAMFGVYAHVLPLISFDGQVAYQRM